MIDYDVVVVGAGPAGLMAAKYARIHGASVLIIEEHSVIGEPVQCAGLISVKAYKVCEVPDSLGKRQIRGAVLHAPDGRTIYIDGKRTMAYVIDRRELDRAMALAALKAGVDTLVKTRFNCLERKGSSIVVKMTSYGEPIKIRTKVLIGADGVQSSVGRAAGIGRVKEVITCVQSEVFEEANSSDFVDLYVGQDVAPGFFAWRIPTRENTMRVGLCSTTRARDRFTFFIKKISSDHQSGLLNFSAGAIPLGPPKSTVADGIIVVGDAAGQVKPTSGGGIYTGAVCAKIAGEVAAKATRIDDTSKRVLAEYDKRWRAQIGKELAIGLKVHEALSKLSDQDLNDVVAAMDDEQVLSIITRYGDIDHPSIVLTRLLFSTKAPKLLALIRPLVTAGLKIT